MPEVEQYPPGSGVAQWILRQEKTFVVGATVRSATDVDARGFWVDPERAKTIR